MRTEGCALHRLMSPLPSSARAQRTGASNSSARAAGAPSWAARSMSEPAAKSPSTGRKLEQPLVRAVTGEDEVEAESSGLALVELRCRNELVLCFGIKFNASHRSVERAFLMTFSAGSPATFPDFSSPRRRSASASQSFSASPSAS